MQLKQKIPDLLTTSEVFRLIEQSQTLKQKTLLSICYGCGLRVSEVTKICLHNIDSKNKLLKITQGKGSKDRRVMLPESLLILLRKYWLQYRPCHWIFYGKDIQTPMSTSTAQNYFNRAKKRAGIKGAGSIHSLRHAYASHQLLGGMPIHVLKEQLGHKNIQSTMRYIHWQPNHLDSKHVDLISMLGV